MRVPAGRHHRLRVVALFKPAARHRHDARVFVSQVDLILVDENKCRAASLRADRRARLGSWEVTVDTGILSLWGRL
jgi:hypothetical protein